MSKAWSEVAASPAYQALPPDQQGAAREQYFAQVVAPQISDPTQQQAAKAQFDAQYGGQSAAPTANAAPPADPSFMQRGYDVSASILQNAMKPIAGVVQGVGHGITGLADAILPEGNAIRGAIDTTNQNFDNNLHNEEANYQTQVPTNAATVTGAAIGQAIPFALDAPGAALKAIGEGAAKLAPAGAGLLARATRAFASTGAQGAAIAATQPVTDPGNYSGQKAIQIGVGGALGAAIPGALSGIKGVNTLARHVYDPKGVASSELGRTLQATPATLDALNNVRQFVPGETPTTAQVIGGTGPVMVEKAFGNTAAGKQALTDIGNNNNAARVSVLRGLAGDDASLQAAKDARTAATQPFIDANLSPTNPLTRYKAAGTNIQAAIDSPSRMPSSDFDALNQARIIINKVKSGAMQEDDALPQLNDLSASVSTQKAQNAFGNAFGAINKNMVDPSGVLQSIATIRNGSLGTNPTVGKSLDAIAGQIKGAQNINGLVGSDLLDGIRQNASRILAANHDQNSLVGSQEEAGIAPVKAQIMALLNKNVPGYAQYLKNYATKSQPINTMQSARAILDPVDNGALNSVGDAQLTLSRLNAGLKKSDAAQYGFSPDAQQKLEGIRQSLQRESISNGIKSPGSDSAYNLQAQGTLARGLLGSSLQGPGGWTRMGAVLSGALLGDHAGGLAGAGIGAGIGAVLDKGANIINQRIQTAYANGLRDPAVAKKMITQYLQKNQANAPAILDHFPQWKALLYQPSLTGQPTGIPQP